MQKAIIITGQTGTGKTRRAINDAKKIGGELISADARLIYKKLDIITGKDVGSAVFQKVHELKLDSSRIADIGYYTLDTVRVWGCDFVNPDTHFSSYDYKLAIQYILRNAIAKSSVPIIVGGTHLYIKHLLQPFDFAVGPQWKLRTELEDHSLSKLQEKLKNLDNEVFLSMNSSDQANPRRLIRKIEIAMSPKQILKEPMKNDVDLEIEKRIGLRYSTPEDCRLTISDRIQQRISNGAIEEVEKLLAEGYTENDPGLHTIGYKELMGHIRGETSLEEACDKWLTAEVQYAKRQLSFMKQDSAIEWYNVHYEKSS
ncbi:hypothetical protein KBD09_03025 [Candidatus Woesebacteria bacterium]|nr:hypothetical protein [Candidatus Woesebacteria bacterium]